MLNILGDIVDHTDDAAGYLYSGDEGRWAECEPLPLKDMPHSQVLRVRPALGTPIGDGNFDIGDVQPHEMARCKAWAKRVSHEIRTQLRTWLRTRAAAEVERSFLEAQHALEERIATVSAKAGVLPEHG